MRQARAQCFAAEAARALQADGQDGAVREEHKDGGQQDSSYDDREVVDFAQQCLTTTTAQTDQAVDVAAASGRAADGSPAAPQCRPARQAAASRAAAVPALWLET